MWKRWLTNSSRHCVVLNKDFILEVVLSWKKQLVTTALKCQISSLWQRLTKSLFVFGFHFCCLLPQSFFKWMNVRGTQSVYAQQQRQYVTVISFLSCPCVWSVFLQIHLWLCAQTLKGSTAPTYTPTRRMTWRTVSDCSLSIMTVCTAHLSAACRHTNPLQLEPPRPLYLSLNILTEMANFFFNEIVLTERISRLMWMLVRSFSRLVALEAK